MWRGQPLNHHAKETPIKNLQYWYNKRRKEPLKKIPNHLLKDTKAKPKRFKAIASVANTARTLK